MLVEFRVKNFRSIRNEQCLSLVAAKDRTHVDTHVIKVGKASTPNLLKSAVIYGPNAAGKSNLINALTFMQMIVANSAIKMNEGQKFNCPSFRLDSAFKDQPSEFELTFVDQDIRYQYGFSLVPERVIEEWLIVYKTAKPQKWFSRRFDSKTGREKYDFGSHLTGQRSLWQESTRSNALFLSKAVDLNSECLRPIFLWIVQNLTIIPAGNAPVFDFSNNYALMEEGKNEVLQFLKAADLSIADLKFENKKMKQYKMHLEDGKTPLQTLTEYEAPMPLFFHETKEGTASFELSDESMGTQRFFAFAGPILDVLKNGHVMVVDELDSSLHSLMIRFLISQFHSLQNTKGAQLIFSTHDTSLLDNDIFRRDQIWLIEKDLTQASNLYPLTDFSPRKNESLSRGYLLGRYGALPFISDFRIGEVSKNKKGATKLNSSNSLDKQAKLKSGK